MQQRKWLWRTPLLFVGLIALATLYTSLAAPPAQTVTTLRLGFLEGSGAPGDLGLRLAVDQINRAGGMSGPDGTSYRLEIVYPPRPPLVAEDVPPILESFRNQGVTAIIGPVNNALALPNLEPLARAGVPILTLATSDTLTDVDVTNNIMRMRAAERFYSYGLVDVLINDLSYSRIALIQTDVDSTEALLIFEQGMINNGQTPVAKLQRLDGSTLTEDAAEILQAAPDAVVMWGPPQDAATLLQTLRAGNFQGGFAYRDALEAIQGGFIPARLGSGMIGATSWAYTTPNEVSHTFLVDYVTTYNAIPNGIEAAAYDSVWILRRQIEVAGPEMPGLYEGLLQTPTLVSIQGRLEPLSYGNGDFARHVMVYSIGDRGGPQILVRYADNFRVPDDDLIAEDTPRLVGMLGTLTFTPSPSPIPSETPIPSATPSQVTITVNLPTANIRSGPGTDFERIGTLEEGEQMPVVGGNEDFSWFVIMYRGNQAWISEDVVDVFDPGNLLAQLPVIQPVIVTTPIVAGTPAPSNGVDLIVSNIVLSPAQPVPGQAFAAQVTVSNIGNAAAGAFVVGTTFEPGSVPASATVNSLDPGATLTVSLPATVFGTGAFTTSVVVDSTNSVIEANENNNIFTFSYRIDYPVIAEVQAFAVPVNVGIDLAGGTGDLLWTGFSLETQNGAAFGTIANAVYESVFYSAIDYNSIFLVSLADSQVQQNALFSVRTAEGRRGVIRIDGRAGTGLTISFRIYSDTP